MEERTVDLVIEPVIADLRYEQSAACGLRGAIVYLRGQLALLSSTRACLFDDERKPLPAGFSSRACLAIGVFAAVGAMILVAVFQRTVTAAVDAGTPGGSPMVTEWMRKREVHDRVAVILMPITLCALGVAASRRVRRPIRAALVWWVSTGGGWFVILFIAIVSLHHTSAENVSPWVPHGAALIVTGLLERRRNHDASEARG